MRIKKIFIQLLFLSIGLLIIRCDNSGSGSIFGSLGGDKSKEEKQTEGSVSEEDLKESYQSKNISGLRYIPEGFFYPAEDLGKMSVSPFRIGIYEITRAEYYNIMGEKPWLLEAYEPYTLSDVYSEEDIEKNPATGMNWFEVIVFCNKLSIKENLKPVYTLPGKGINPDDWGAIPGTTPKLKIIIEDDHDNNSGKEIQDNPVSLWNKIEADWSANGYRLPTEMEYLWAAMGGIDTQNRRFSGDNGRNKIDDYAWYNSNSENNTHPVGEKRQNSLLLFDMTGNVMEWCWDIAGISEEMYTTIIQAIIQNANQEASQDVIQDENQETNHDVAQDENQETGQNVAQDANQEILQDITQYADIGELTIENGFVLIKPPKNNKTDYRGIILPSQINLPDLQIIQRAVAGGSWESTKEKSLLTYGEVLLSENRFPEQRDTKKIGFRVVRK